MAEYGLLLLAFATTAFAPLVLVIQHERGFPMSRERNGAFVLLVLDAAVEWILVGAPAAQSSEEGTLLTLGTLAVVNGAAAAFFALRARTLLPLLRGILAACFALEPLLLWWVLS